jgi:hypothetical protein
LAPKKHQKVAVAVNNKNVVNECDPKKVAINPVCYPQAEQGDVVDRYEEKVGNGVK